MSHPDIIVIGGGPAGMMAAIRSSQLGRKVLLIEKGESLGRKFLLTGKGRGNLTNAGDISTFIENFSRSGNFLRNAFSRFFNQDLMAFLENNGVALKTERQGRVFPQSDDVKEVIACFTKNLAENKVKIIYHQRVRTILVEKKQVCAVELENGEEIPTHKVILATGGASYPETGSTGDGQKIVEKLGHKIIPLRPALVPLLTREKWVKDLQGLTLKNVRISFLRDNKKIFSEIGELLFTHFGVSGPVVLSASGDIVDILSKKKGEVWLSLDLKPGLDQQSLDKRLQRELKGAKDFKNLLKDYLPSSFIPVFVRLIKIDSGKKAHQITQAERKRIIALFKDLRLQISGFLPLKEAMLTRGGVSTKEINPQTMESKLIKGLYFAGEIIDVDAKTGGYNLQAAFSTGWLAGENAAGSL
jgi:predicted Rossmann fold flavoprotein